MGDKLLMGYKGTSMLNTGYFYCPYIPIYTTPPHLDTTIRRGTIHLRRLHPKYLEYYHIHEVRAVIKAVRVRPRWLAWPPIWWFWRTRWTLYFGDDRAVPDPVTECAVRLCPIIPGDGDSISDEQLAVIAGLDLPSEIWLWRDKYWVDTMLDWTIKSTPYLDPNSFKPSKSILTRYSKKLLAESQKYYSKITIRDL